MLRSARPTIGFALLALIACSRKDAAKPAPDAGATEALVSSAPDAAPTAAVSVSDAGITLAKVIPAEARRLRAVRLADVPLGRSESASAAAAKTKALLEQHFGNAAGPFDVQTAELTAAGRRAVLVQESGKATGDARPIALVLDEDGGVIWSKERPVAGIMPPVGPVAIAAAPMGRVAIAACDPPTRLVALRLWDSDGFPFADLQAMANVDTCEALALLYWPEHGFVLVSAGTGVTRARLVKESGAPTWGEGLDLGVRSKPGAISAPSLAADTDDSFVLVQLAQPSGQPGSPFHALAFRYDATGAPIWKEAVDLGELPRPPADGEKARVVPIRPGVRVTLPSGTEVDVKPSGDRVTRGRAQP